MNERPVTIGSGVVVGVDAIPVTIEATMFGGDSGPRILGSVDSVVREAFHRVLSAFSAHGLPPPRGVPTLNFVPAGVRKTGAGFDLPMALALAGAGGHLPRECLAGLCAFGEVSLEGRVLPVRGVVSVAIAARELGMHRLLTSPEDACRAAVVAGIEVVAVRGLGDAVRSLRGEQPFEVITQRSAHDILAGRSAARPDLDLADIRGQETPKRALLVAAAGRHNLLMVGPPGSGKSALLQRIGPLLPPADDAECLEILKIHSAHGPSGAGPALWRFDPGGRPLRAPHHTSSVASILGGGPDPRPGEVTLAQHGVLFLDELPEFRREVLEGLRQPMEDCRVTIGRAQRTVTMPADFLLVAAMNPCPCGYSGDTARPCVCSPAQRQRYRARISGPLLDRFDLTVEVPTLPPEKFREPVDPAWSTAALHDRVAEATLRQRQRNRRGGRSLPNGRLDGRLLERAVGSADDVHETLDQVMRTYHLSGRARVRILRAARTLADLDARERVQRSDVLLAARLRGFDPHRVE